MSQETIKRSVGIVLDHHTRKILPVASKRNILITSALPYVNNVPHLGNIIGCVLSADVFARFSRLRNNPTLFVCGTDEYGTATETKAIELGVSCQALCDEYHQVHAKCYEWFQIDFDYFGRTTTPHQTTIAQDIFNKCDANGFIKPQTVTQLYCPHHESFLADRFVEGICPKCKYTDARGDQCDGCGQLLNATDLIKPRCKLDGTAPILKDSDHLFLDLATLQGECESWFDASSKAGKWSANGVTITQSWLKEGLRQRCITRDLKWGTQVPKAGYESKVFYVWFDAPIGYLSISAGYTPEWEKWWKKDNEDIKLFQFMGKDNVPFHSVIFPCSLIGTGEQWTLVDHISTTEYLQYEGTKFSKSRGIGVFGNNVMDSGIPVEVWRFYLLSIRPETSDSQFTWSGLISANNNECLANLGNLCNRVIKFAASKYSNTLPYYEHGDIELKALADINTCIEQYIALLSQTKLRQALKTVMDICSILNTYLQDNKIDNTLFINNRTQCDNVMGFSINGLYLVASLVYPFMPSTAESLLAQLNITLFRTLDGIECGWDGKDVLEGHVLGKQAYLFKRIDEALEQGLRLKYGGGQGVATVEEVKPKKGKKPSHMVAKSYASTPETIVMEGKIQDLGDEIRLLKQGKAESHVIQERVQLLLQLKLELDMLTTSI